MMHDYTNLQLASKIPVYKEKDDLASFLINYTTPVAIDVRVPADHWPSVD